MQGKALEIAVGDIGHVTINDADTVLNRLDGMKDLNAIVAAMTGRLYHGTEAADSLRVAALRNRLRASKSANHAKQARIIALESENASALSQIEWLNHVADVMTKGNTGLLEDNQRLRAELKRLTTPTVALTDNITPALQAMADDETMLREMAAEDAARQSSGQAYAITPDGIRAATDEERALLGLPPVAPPLSEDIIKEAAAILGDPRIVTTLVATADQPVGTEVIGGKVSLNIADAAKMHDAMTAAVNTADGVTVPWNNDRLSHIANRLASNGIHVMPHRMLHWKVHQLVQAENYVNDKSIPMPDFLAHYAP